jgi:hypothetical protein
MLKLYLENHYKVLISDMTYGLEFTVFFFKGKDVRQIKYFKCLKSLTL